MLPAAPAHPSCDLPSAGTQRTAQGQGQEEGAQGCSRREKLQRKSSGCARERCSPTALGAGPSPLLSTTGAAPLTGRHPRESTGEDGCCWRNSRGSLLPIPSHLPRGRCGRQRPRVCPADPAGPSSAAAQMGEEGKATPSEPSQPGAEPRRDPKCSQVFPALPPLHPLALTEPAPILRPSQREKRAGGFSQAEVAGFRAINCSSFISCLRGFHLCGYTKASEHSHNLSVLFAESHRRAPCAQCTEENTPLPQGTHSLQHTDQPQSQRLAEELALGKVERVGEGWIPHPTARPRHRSPGGAGGRGHPNPGRKGLLQGCWVRIMEQESAGTQGSKKKWGWAGLRGQEWELELNELASKRTAAGAAGNEEALLLPKAHFSLFLRRRNHLGSELCNVSVLELESPSRAGSSSHRTGHELYTGNSTPLAHGIPLQRGHKPPSARD